MTTLDRSTAWLVPLALLLMLSGGLPACSDCSLSVSTASLPDGIVGMNYFTELDSHCGGDVWFVQDGSSLPPGIELQDNGDVQGIPTLEGTYIFTVGVYDFGSNETAYKGLSIRVTRQ